MPSFRVSSVLKGILREVYGVVGEVYGARQRNESVVLERVKE
jgi:hypothetical protein